MLIGYHLGATSVVLRVKLRQDTTGAAPGKGKTGMTGSSTGLIISTIADDEAAATAYTAAGSQIQTIATLGTYAAPSASDCRFAEVDSTNHPGVYEIQLANARFAVASAKSLLISITGVSGLADCDVTIPLTTVDPYSTTFGITGNVPANVAAVNADTTAPGNIALTFNGSGYVAPTAPAQQQQVANIAVTGAALNQTASSRTLTTGSETNAYTDTFTDNQVYHTITSAGGTIDIYYEFTLGSTGQAGTGMFWNGYVGGTVNSIKVYAYNWGNAAWDQIGTIVGITGTTESSVELDLTNSHTGTGGNLGKVRIRFQNTGLTAATLNTDFLLVGYTTVLTPPANWSLMSIDGSGRVDIGKALGNAVTTTASGILDVNAKNINNVSASSVTTINANIGETQPLNFTGTGGSALVQVDTRGFLGQAVVLDANNFPKVDTVDWAGGTIPAPNVTGVPLTDLKYTLGTLSAGQAGSVGIDWAQVANATSSVNLSNTNIDTDQTIATVTNQLTAAAIATGVWQDTTAGDFTVSGSIGKSLFTSGNAPGAASGIALVGSNMGTVTSVTGTVGSVTGTVGSVTGNVGGNVNGSVASVTAAVTLSAGDSPTFFTGTATAGGATTLTDSGQTWTVNALAGCRVKITSATGAKQSRVIVSNTATVLTVDYAWTTNPDNTSVYAVVEGNSPKIDSSLRISEVMLVDTVTNPSAAAIATAVWQDTTAGDFATVSSPGHILVTQLGGTFTTTGSSVFSVPALANAPTGGSAPTTAQIATAVWQDLTSSGDFGTAGSIGNLLRTDIDTNIGSRLAAGAVTVGSYSAGQDPWSLIKAATPSGTPTAGTVEWLLRILDADPYLVTSGSPWVYSYQVRGSGAPGTGTTLMSKNVYDTTGSPLSSSTVVVGTMHQ